MEDCQRPLAAPLIREKATRISVRYAPSASRGSRSRILVSRRSRAWSLWRVSDQLSDYGCADGHQWVHVHALHSRSTSVARGAPILVRDEGVNVEAGPEAKQPFEQPTDRAHNCGRPRSLAGSGGASSSPPAWRLGISPGECRVPNVSQQTPI
jgi:hypothetical protein